MQEMKNVLAFWFSAEAQPYWFAKSDDFDAVLRTKFGQVWAKAKQAELAHWRSSPEGRVAEIIVLDQFSRNLCREQPTAFSQDGMALVLAQELVALPEFAGLTGPYRQFALMPYMHSESAAIHVEAVRLFTEHTDANTLDFEMRHKAIIDRFGRYPHRNKALSRSSSEEEIAFLQEDGSSF
ncbi:MAG: DUF924 domain-containing protein [Neisseriaceae bacterium]|nr:DUF924 domain-containing protein [Neisseriaceae bacterium]MBP6861647.1 DUF924 domain-containing protein [Neisseriaceae bacterium]